MSDKYDKEYYQPHEGSYTTSYTWEQEKETCIRKATALSSLGEVFLDVGCGKGFLVKALRSQGKVAYGFDVSKWAIENCDADVKLVVNTQSAIMLPWGDTRQNVLML